MKMTEWNIGVIGAGYWGSKHVREFAALPGTRVTVADLKQENLEFCRQKFGVQTTSDYRQLLADRNIEYVSICTTNESHYSLAKEALLAGKNVLVEKPLAKRVEECSELIKIAEEAGLTLAVGHLFRFNNAINKVREMLLRGELGEAFVLKFKWVNSEPMARQLFTNRDVIYDLAPHPFDLADYLLGRTPTRVSCVASALRQKEVVEAAFINARLGNALLNVEVSWVTPPKERSMLLVASKKTALVNITEQKLAIYDNESGLPTQVPITPNNMFRDEFLHFLETAKNKSANIAGGKVGRKVVEMLELCEKDVQARG